MIGVDDEDFGKGSPRTSSSAGDETPGADELKDYVSENLARYKVPRDIHFIDELPRNATGKVLKRNLR